MIVGHNYWLIVIDMDGYIFKVIFCYNICIPNVLVANKYHVKFVDFENIKIPAPNDIIYINNIDWL